MDDKRLLELYYEIKKCPSHQVKSLLNDWKFYTGCEYPRIKNKKGKEIDFLQYYKKPKEVKITNSLDDLIAAKTSESKLISNTLYSHTYTDIPDPNRKRKKY